jgi:hypothetical protein
MTRPLRIPPTAALAEMLERDQQAGVDVFDHGGPPEPPGPSERARPLPPPIISRLALLPLAG